jgi:fatty-acyl-CoA synthase
LHRHPAVLLAAVVARPDPKWGETPCAFIELKTSPDAIGPQDDAIGPQDIIDFCRANLAHYKCPTRVVFGEIPKTSTGKVQKFKLRDWAKDA